MLKCNDDLVEDKDSFDKEVIAVKNLKSLTEKLDLTDESYLKRFLYGTNFNVDEAFRKIKSCHEHVMEYQDWYRKDGPIKLKSVIDMDIRVVLPGCDKEGRPIYLIKNGNIDVNKISMYDVLAVDDVWLEFILNQDPEAAAKGLCVITDIKDQSWKISKWMQPNIIRQSVKKIDNLPFSEYKVHVVNNSWWINIGIKLIWPFLPNRFKEMMKFHFDNMDSFHEYIDKEVLPIEYGGFKEISYSDIYENLYKRNDEIFKSFNSYRNIKK